MQFSDAEIARRMAAMSRFTSLLEYVKSAVLCTAAGPPVGLGLQLGHCSAHPECLLRYAVEHEMLPVLAVLYEH